MSLRPARMTHLRIDDPAGSARLTKMRYVPFGENYVLHPRSFVLAVILEWMRLPKLSLHMSLVDQAGGDGG